MDRPEEFEHIPWSELAADMEQPRRPVAYVLTGIILAVAAGAVVARAVWPRGDTELVSASSIPETIVATEELAPPLPEPTLTTLPELSQPTLYSEADLLAVPPSDAARAAVTRAEWFVTDYFTADLDPGGSLDVLRALPPGVDIELPHDAPGAAISYVEWARAFSVAPVGADLHAVEVAFRTIGGPQEGPLVRQPVRAVRVAVQGDAFGLAVVDLPTPVALPAEVEAAQWPNESVELPEEIAAAALGAAKAWGDGAAVLDGAAVGNSWRVLVEVDGGAGNRWPLALWLDDLGELTAPPWVESGG